MSAAPLRQTAPDDRRRITFYAPENESGGWTYQPQWWLNYLPKISRGRAQDWIIFRIHFEVSGKTPRKGVPARLWSDPISDKDLMRQTGCDNVATIRMMVADGCARGLFTTMRYEQQKRIDAGAPPDPDLEVHGGRSTDRYRLLVENWESIEPWETTRQREEEQRRKAAEAKQAESDKSDPAEVPATPKSANTFAVSRLQSGKRARIPMPTFECEVVILDNALGSDFSVEAKPDGRSVHVRVSRVEEVPESPPAGERNANRFAVSAAASKSINANGFAVPQSRASSFEALREGLDPILKQRFHASCGRDLLKRIMESLGSFPITDFLEYARVEAARFEKVGGLVVLAKDCGRGQRERLNGASLPAEAKSRWDQRANEAMALFEPVRRPR